MQPDDDAETAALQAVEHHEADVAVVDRQLHLLGAIPIGRLLALLHEEHVDNFLRMGGVSDVHPEPLSEHNTMDAFRARIPWLAIGLLPLGVAHLGVDPALASGPVATVLQDLLSVALYLSIATMVLHW